MPKGELRSPETTEPSSIAPGMATHTEKGTPSAEAWFPEAGLVPRDITRLAFSASRLLDVRHELNHPEIEVMSFREHFDAGGPPGESRNADGADQGSKARKEERTVGRRACSYRSRGIEGYRGSSFRRIRYGLMNETLRPF